MHASDSAVTRFIFEDLDICGALVCLGGAWREMLAGRDYPPRVQAMLGEMTAVATVIGSNLKTPGRLTFQAHGQGPVSMLVVDCEQREQEVALLIRGMARVDDAGEDGLPDRPLRELLGDGALLFSLQSAMTDMPYQSHVSLAGDSLARIFEQFMSQSAQQPARLWLAADAECAVGLFLQTLPPREREQPVDADGWERVQQLAATLRPEELRLPAETLLGRLFPEETLRLFSPRPVSYYCPRDEDKVRAMLTSLGREEVAELLAEHGEIVIRDDIGNHEYRFGAGVLEELFPSAGRTLH